MKDKLVRFIGASILVNIVGFVVGLLYLWGKLDTIREITKVNPFSVVSRAMPNIAITFAVYLIVDWFLLILVCAIGIYIINVVLSKRSLWYDVILWGCMFFIVLMQNGKETKVDTVKMLMACMILTLSYAYINWRLFYVYSKNSLNKRIQAINKKLKYFTDKDYGGNQCKIPELVPNMVGYDEKKRLDIIQDMMGIWDKYLSKCEVNPEHMALLPDRSSIELINLQITAINETRKFGDIANMREARIELNNQFKAYKKASGKISDENKKQCKRLMQDLINRVVIIGSVIGGVVLCLYKKGTLIGYIWDKIIKGIIIIGVAFFVGKPLIKIIRQLLKIMLWLFNLIIGKKNINLIVSLARESFVNPKDAIGNYLERLMSRLYYLCNNRLISYSMIIMLLGGCIYFLGVLQSGIDVYDENGDISTAQIVFNDENRVPVIIINNDDRCIVYYNLSTSRIEEIEKIASSYNITRIEYNQPKLIMEEQDDKKGYISHITDKEKVDIEKFINKFLKVMYPKNKDVFTIKNIAELYDSDTYKYSKDITAMKREEEIFFYPGIDITIKRNLHTLFDEEGQYKYEQPLDYKIVGIFKEKNAESYEVYVRCYFYKYIDDYKLSIHNKAGQGLCIYDMKAVRLYE